VTREREGIVGGRCWRFLFVLLIGHSGSRSSSMSSKDLENMIQNYIVLHDYSLIYVKITTQPCKVYNADQRLYRNTSLECVLN